MTTTLPPVLDERIPLAFLPTPVHPLDAFSEALGGSTRIWVKRDDQTGLATGGNKARKLEYLVHAALAEGATALVTGGALQSNHARQTAAAAARLGLKCTLALVPGALDTVDYTTSGNMLLDDILGAAVYLPPAGTDMPTAIAEAADALRAAGETPYVVPVGGSSPVGCLGYVRCAQEISAEAASGLTPAFGAVVIGTGSGGTQAGLVTGFHGVTDAPPVIGMSVAAAAADQIAKVHGLSAEVAELLSLATTPSIDEVIVDDRYVGPGYGVPTDGMREAVSLLARSEGLLADPVYTGKALAGLIAHIRSGEGPIAAAGEVLFVHTGGQAGLFAYKDALTA
jgi:D-cysteine desulfhydrase family pyridoxal phosphate-dependent enzyme